MTASQAPEQRTMEEILASIRQFISDDEAKNERRATAPDPAPGEAIGPASRSVAEERTGGAAIDRTPRATGLAPAPPRRATAPRFGEEPSQRKVSPFRPPDTTTPVRAHGEAAAEEDDDPLPRIVQPQTARTAAKPPEPLLTSSAEAAVRKSLEEVAMAARSTGGRPLTTLVEETLRPMLKRWLDENLPPLVERLVQEEIERIARGR